MDQTFQNRSIGLLTLRITNETQELAHLGTLYFKNLCGTLKPRVRRLLVLF